MDPFWHIRPLFPYPLLFGLVDDVSTLLVEKYLGLTSSEAVANDPANIVALMTLRLINRENYFYCQRRGFPLLIALPSMSAHTKKNGTTMFTPDIRPWYGKSKIVDHVIGRGKFFSVFRNNNYWLTFKETTMGIMARHAIDKRNIAVFRSIMAEALDSASNTQREQWQKRVVDTDFGDAYGVMHAKHPPLIIENNLIQILTADAVACFRVVLAPFLKRMRSLHKFLLGANRLLQTLGHTQRNIVLIRAVVDEMLEPLRPTIAKRAPASRKRKRAPDDDDVVEIIPPAKLARIDVDALSQEEEEEDDEEDETSNVNVAEYVGMEQ